MHETHRREVHDTHGPQVRSDAAREAKVSALHGLIWETYFSNSSYSCASKVNVRLGLEPRTSSVRVFPGEL